MKKITKTVALLTTLSLLPVTVSANNQDDNIKIINETLILKDKLLDKLGNDEEVKKVATILQNDMNSLQMNIANIETLRSKQTQLQTKAEQKAEELTKIEEKHQTNLERLEELKTQLAEKQADEAKKVEEAKQAEEKRLADEARKTEEKRLADARNAQAAAPSAPAQQAGTAQAEPDTEATPITPPPAGNVTPYFGNDGLLVMKGSSAAQNVVNLLLGIPGHANGKGYHASTGLDNYINQLSVEEATWVIHRIEGAGFGQTAAGYAGIDSNLTHQKFIEQQVNGRFGGSIYKLLHAWGTFSYSGY